MRRHRGFRLSPRAAGALLLVLGCATAPGAAFIREWLSTSDPTYLRWDLDETTLTLPNVAGGEIVFVIDSAGSQNIPGTEDSDGIVRAFQHWEGVGTSRVAFVRGADQTPLEANNDGVNAVYFAEAANTRIGGVRTSVTGFISMTPLFFSTAGASKGIILDANIVLNGRENSWTTTPPTNPTAYDVEAVVTHEVGHFIGLDHTGVLAASMSPRYFPGEARQRILESDDVLGASAIYPDGIFSTLGGISGLVGRPAVVPGALVGVADISGNVLQESITGPNGAYTAPGLPGGDYVAWVEPVDKLPPTTTNLFDQNDLGRRNPPFSDEVIPPVDPNFFASITVQPTVTPPGSTTQSFSVGTTAPVTNISKIGARSATIPGVVFRNAPTFVFSGDTNVFIGVAGPNIDSTATFEILGTGITDNGEVSAGIVDGEPYVIHSISVAPGTPPGLRSFRITAGVLGRTYATGAIRIYPSVAMSLTAPGHFLGPPPEAGGGDDAGLTVTLSGNDVQLDWDDLGDAYGYNVYRGTLGALGAGLYDHQAIPGTVNGPCRVTTSGTVLKGEALDPAGVYYLVTAFNNAGEGIVGADSEGNLLPPPAPACPAP